MKNFVITLCALLSALIPVAEAQHVEFSDVKPRPGKDLTFRYKPANDLTSAESVTAIVYFFEAAQVRPVAKEIKLEPAGGTFTGTISAPADARVVWFKFLSGDKKDTNEGKGYYTLIYNSDGQPVKGALAVLADAGNSFGWLLGIDADTRGAYEYLKEEFKLHPELKTEFLATYASLVKANDDETAKEEVRTLIGNLTGKKKASEEELRKARLAQMRLGDRGAAEALQKRIIKEFPNGKTALDDKVSSFYGEKDLVAKERIFKQIQPRLPEEQVNYLASALASLFGPSNKEKFDVYTGMIGNKSTLADTYNSIAWRMSGERIDNEGKDLDVALKLSAQSLELVRASMTSDEGKPEYMGSSEWKKNLEGSYGMFADTYALIQFKRGEFADALKYQEYFNQYGYPDAEANERYVAYVEKVKGKDAALEVIAKFVVEGNSTGIMKEKFKTFLGSYPSEEAATKSLALLEMQAREKLKKDVEKLMIDKDAPEFTLKDLEGKEVSMESLKGKTVVIDFWATWCGPCIASFPGMQQAVNKYKDDESVKFLFVDSWENGDKDKKLDVVSKFIQNKGYTFQVLMDLEDKVINAYGVEGIPTKFVIGPDGRMKFKKIGGGAADKLIDELYIMIELVKTNSEKGQGLSVLRN